MKSSSNLQMQQFMNTTQQFLKKIENEYKAKTSELQITKQ